MSDNKLSAVEDISHVNKRERQPSVVEMLERLAQKADEGELVGVLVIHVDRKGVWHHDRDLFAADTPTLLGYLFMILQKLTRHYLDGCPQDEDKNPTG